MTRKTKLIFNTFAAFVKQAITIICGFILPRFILKGYGSEVNGLITSITQFLGFISFLEIREFHKSIRYKTEKHYPRRVGRTAPGVERFLLLLMQNWPGRRSYTQIF